MGMGYCTWPWSPCLLPLEPLRLLPLEPLRLLPLEPLRLLPLEPLRLLPLEPLRLLPLEPLLCCRAMVRDVCVCCAVQFLVAQIRKASLEVEAGNDGVCDREGAAIRN